MGGLLNVFKGPDYEAHPVDIFFDFQHVAEPVGEEDLEIYNSINDVLNRSPEILTIIENYNGCGTLIHTAINKPTHDNEVAVWEDLIPNVKNLQQIYEYSADIMGAANQLLTTLCKPGNDLQNQVALAKLLCDLFNFVLKFDDKKMMNPHVNNDFSYYRRSLTKLRSNGYGGQLPDDVANKMSLFFAYPTPMMNMLSTQSKLGGLSSDIVVAGLSTFANVCLDMVEKNSFNDPNLNIYCLRAMTAAIILVDHISPEGVFCRRSLVNIKQAITLLREKENELETLGLINSLKYTTRHLKDEETPEMILELLN